MIAATQKSKTSEEYQEHFSSLQEELKEALIAKLPEVDADKKQAFMEMVKGKDKKKILEALKALQLEEFLASDGLDSHLLKSVVLIDGTAQSLAEFSARGDVQAALIEEMFADRELMKLMLLADGPAAARVGRGHGPAQFGSAMRIYKDIQKVTTRAEKGIFQRLAMAMSLVHAVPVGQRNPKGAVDAPEHVDPVKRYLHYEKAYLDGELDSGFKNLTTFDLRHVIFGEEPDETLAWGREMLRNFRPEHVYNPNHGWRYMGIVGSDVRYGSGDVKYDRPELQFFQNILMNGGICGRRAFFGRFILRAFGVPNTARPQRGHAALARSTPEGWIVCLGSGWGGGWTKTLYKKDLDFLATTQARRKPQGFLQVKRAQWVGDVLGETRIYGEHGGDPEFWNAVSLYTQRAIIESSDAKVLGPLGEDIGESNKMTEAEKIMSRPETPGNRKIVYGEDGGLTIPAAAYTLPKGNTKEVISMKSFDGGLQVFFPRFGVAGVTIMKGGAWRGGAASCRSGWRMPSSGYGRYNNWGFRAAMSPPEGEVSKELTLDLGDDISMEFVYIKPGTFVMGGEDATHGKWHGTETPKHEVTLTKGYYMAKYEVTQEQFQKIMGSNPSKASKKPKCPADNIGEGDAVDFCNKLAAMSGKSVRLPTEAEWEYACRAGTTTKYFFGDTPEKLGEYAWFKDNDGGSSHPVGLKKPNPWGLYDMVGNVVERVSDRYSKDYYKRSPKKDPTGMGQSDKSLTEYKFKVAKAGTYNLTAKVVTANYDQKLFVSTNGGKYDKTLKFPFTCGKWEACEPLTLNLIEGENTLSFLRREAPQQGVTVKEFVLKPL